MRQGVLCGLTFTVPDGLDPDEEILERYGNRSQTQRYKVQPGDTVVELGAFVGFHAMRLAQAVGPTGRVIAVEMMPEYAQICRRNFENNRLTQATVVPCAVATKDAWAEAHCDRHQRNSLVGGIVQNDGSAQRSVMVPALTVDQILDKQEVSKCDLLIVQINGTEIEALRAVKNWDRIRNIAVATQYWKGGHDFRWYTPWSCPPLVELLTQNGFQAEEINSWVYGRKISS